MKFNSPRWHFERTGKHYRYQPGFHSKRPVTFPDGTKSRIDCRVVKIENVIAPRFKCTATHPKTGLVVDVSVFCIKARVPELTLRTISNYASSKGELTLRTMSNYASSKGELTLRTMSDFASSKGELTLRTMSNYASSKGELTLRTMSNYASFKGELTFFICCTRA